MLKPPQQAKREMARVLVEWDPNEGKLNLSFTGVNEMEALGLLLDALNVQWAKMHGLFNAPRVTPVAGLLNLPQ